MFSFHKPKIYRSVSGCCICRAKSSSSRFTDSKKYETEFERCFRIQEKRSGEICNACVLLVKRWKKLSPENRCHKHWHHVVDARAGPGTKGGPSSSSSSSANCSTSNSNRNNQNLTINKSNSSKRAPIRGDKSKNSSAKLSRRQRQTGANVVDDDEDNDNEDSDDFDSGHSSESATSSNGQRVFRRDLFSANNNTTPPIRNQYQYRRWVKTTTTTVNDISTNKTNNKSSELSMATHATVDTMSLDSDVDNLIIDEDVCDATTTTTQLHTTPAAAHIPCVGSSSSSRRKLANGGSRYVSPMSSSSSSSSSSSNGLGVSLRRPMRSSVQRTARKYDNRRSNICTNTTSNKTITAMKKIVTKDRRRQQQHDDDDLDDDENDNDDEDQDDDDDDDDDDESMPPTSANTRHYNRPTLVKRERAMKSSDAIDHSMTSSFLDMTLWKKEKICCGIIFKNLYNEVAIFPKLLRPCACRLKNIHQRLSSNATTGNTNSNTNSTETDVTEQLAPTNQTNTCHPKQCIDQLLMDTSANNRDQVASGLSSSSSSSSPPSSSSSGNIPENSSSISSIGDSSLDSMQTSVNESCYPNVDAIVPCASATSLSSDNDSFSISSEDAESSSSSSLGATANMNQPKQSNELAVPVLKI